MTHQFDTQAFVRRMESAGMARQVAEELADALGGVVLEGLATRRDLHDTENRLSGHLRETELRLRQDIRESELRTLVRLGSMVAGAMALIIGILGALITLN